MKKIFIYLSYVILFEFLIIIGAQYKTFLSEEYMTMLPCIVFRVLYYIFMGTMIALPQFVLALRRQGQFKFDWILCLAVGLPTLLVATTPLIGFTPIAHYWPLMSFVVSHDLIPSLISGIICGYTILISFITLK